VITKAAAFYAELRAYRRDDGSPGISAERSRGLSARPERMASTQ